MLKRPIYPLGLDVTKKNPTALTKLSNLESSSERIKMCYQQIEVEIQKLCFYQSQTFQEPNPHSTIQQSARNVHYWSE